MKNSPLKFDLIKHIPNAPTEYYNDVTHVDKDNQSLLHYYLE